MTLSYRHLPEDRPVAFPARLGVFKCLVLIERPVAPAFRERVSRVLVARGCLYCMAWGQECSAWDDSVDIASLERFDWGEIPAARFVITTWHDGETLDEVIRYAKVAAAQSYAAVPLRDLLVLDLSPRARRAEIAARFARA